MLAKIAYQKGAEMVAVADLADFVQRVSALEK
jgi:hypothetical protein